MKLVISVVLFLFITTTVYPMTIYYYSYRQGQIDAINGKINYKLVKQPNGTIVWKAVK